VIASARLYSWAPSLVTAWRRLIDWAATSAGVELDFSEQSAPMSLEDDKTSIRIVYYGSSGAGKTTNLQRIASLIHGDGTGRITARWFRVPGGMARAFDKGKVVALAGPLRLDKNGQPELHHPINVTATLAQDGTPHLTTLFHVVDDRGRIAFWTYGRSQKIRNLERDPRISMLVEDGEDYFELRGVSIQGRARLVEE